MLHIKILKDCRVSKDGSNNAFEFKADDILPVDGEVLNEFATKWLLDNGYGIEAKMVAPVVTQDEKPAKIKKIKGGVNA